MVNFRISRHPVKALLCLLVLMAGTLPGMPSWGALTVEAPKPGQFRAPFDKRRGIHSYADLVDATVGAIVRINNWQKVEHKDKKTKKNLISTNVQQAAAMSRDVVKSLQQPEANEVAWL